MIFKIYNFLSTKYENIKYLKKNLINTNTKLFKDGFEVISANTKINKFDYTEKKNVNEYLQKLIIRENDIDNLIEEFFLKNKLVEMISDKTGFKYRIDFFTAYETLNIPLQMKDKKNLCKSLAYG